MCDHNRHTAVSRFGALWAALLMITAVSAGAQYTNQGYSSNNGSSYGSSRYGSSRYGSSSYGSQAYGSTSYGSSYGSTSYGSSYGSSRYGSSSGSSRYNSRSSSTDNLQSRYGSGSGYSDSTGNSRYSSRSGSSRNSRNTDATKSGKNVDSKTGEVTRAMAGQARQTVTTRKTAPVGAGKRESRGGGGKSAAVGESPVPAEFKSNALYFTPGERELETGDLFDTTISYYSRTKDKLGEVNLWLHYDPKIVEPTWVNTEKLDKLTTAPIEARVWREDGYIHISTRLDRSLADMVNPLVQVNWKAVAPAVESHIGLGAPKGEQATGVYSGGRNLILNNFFADPGDIRLLLHVKTKLADNYYERDLNVVRDSLVGSADLDPLQRVRLAIVPAAGEAAVGKVSTADVMLLNPAGLEFDHIKLRIRYQPDLVQVLDADQDNYITPGINIFDGDFHEQFPFDSLLANQVYPQRGVIDYEVGSIAGPKAYPGGTFARIVYRPLKATNRAVFWFEIEDARTGKRATEVTREGVTLLGKTDEVASAALHGAEVKLQ
ncbi:hypothetical protein LLG95_13795 [bacterium]|nr:hypothetical protein [bacterium]